MRRIVAVLGILALAATLALATLGAEDHPDADRGAEKAAVPRTPGQIEKDALASMRKLRSVHITGKINSGDGMVEVDIRTTKRGDCVGRIGYQGKGHLEMRVVGKATYYRGDKAFWRAAAGAKADRTMQVIGGRWVTGDAATDGIGEICDLDRIFGEVHADENAVIIPDPLYRGSTGMTLRGSYKGAVEIFRVSSTVPRYLVNVEEADGTYLDFAGFDAPVRVQAPAKQDVYDRSRTV